MSVMLLIKTHATNIFVRMRKNEHFCLQIFRIIQASCFSAAYLKTRTEATMHNTENGRRTTLWLCLNGHLDNLPILLGRKKKHHGNSCIFGSHTCIRPATVLKFRGHWSSEINLILHKIGHAISNPAFYTCLFRKD